MAIIFFVLWKLRKKEWPDGKLFTVYLILAGLERLLVEFIRLNPRILFGLSEAQVISIILMIVGVAGYFYFTKKKDLKRYSPPPFIKIESKKK
jgi:phosphatidylglycerol:prolipoprotein diacylglycerol transferase